MHGSELAKRDSRDTGPITTEIGYTDADFAISDRTRERLADAVPPNTRRAYTRQWNLFTTWCAQHGRLALPATAQTLADYVTHLCDAGYDPSTIEQAQGAIRSMHRAAGYPGQPDSAAALVVLRGYRRDRAATGRAAQREAPPVTIPVLRAMTEACDLSTRAGVRDRLVLMLGLALMGRRSELAALHRGDVSEAAEGIEVLVRASKTDKDARGAIIAIPRGTHPLTDPVTAWRAGAPSSMRTTSMTVACCAASGRADGSARACRMSRSTPSSGVWQSRPGCLGRMSTPRTACAPGRHRGVRSRGAGLGHRQTRPVGDQLSGAAALYPRGGPVARKDEGRRTVIMEDK
ncbi:tyrosine-type recombinase/integrase [Acrocarpospora catenulata]|uniref:tyrosine-type recombinase/integrase n=1 Tax=Acrocarpospora catenulata TaxID=2836182 RepID=UPI001BD93A63|nr:site-specific integrase [Acrocarpospora catenulata]